MCCLGPCSSFKSPSSRSSIRQRGSGLPAGAPLFGSLSSADVKSIAIADNSGNEVKLDRADSGWVLAGADGYPASADKVNQTLDKVLAANSNRLVTRTAASHKRLQVAADTFNRRITISSTSGDKVLYLGASAGSGATYVRLDGQNETYMAGDLSPFQLDPQSNSWTDTQFVNIPLGDIYKVAVENAKGAFTLVRNGDKTWSMEGATSDQQVVTTTVSTFINQVSTINLTKPLGKTEQPAYGLDKPLAKVVISARDDKGAETVHTLLIGAKDTTANSYYFKASDSPYYVTIAGFTGDQITGKQGSDFMAAPPAAASPAEGSPVTTALTSDITPTVASGGASVVTSPITSAVTTTTDVVTSADPPPRRSRRPPHPHWRRRRHPRRLPADRDTNCSARSAGTDALHQNGSETLPTRF